MKTIADKSPEPQRQAAAHETPLQQDGSDAELQFVDNRSETANLRQLQKMADNSSRRAAVQNLQEMVDNSPRQAGQQQDSRVHGVPVGLQTESGDMSVQRVEDEAVLQGEFAIHSSTQLAPPDANFNNSGRPGSTQPVLQPMWSALEFKSESDFGRKRKSIAAVDNALSNYEDPLVINKKGALQALIQALNTYITAKQTNDPQNQRIPKAVTLRTDATAELGYITGNEGAGLAAGFAANLGGTLPDNTATMKRVVTRFIDGALIADMQDYIQNSTHALDAILLLERFHQLDAVLTDGLINNHILGHIESMNGGENSTPEDIAVMKTVVNKSQTLLTVKKITGVRFNIDWHKIGALAAGQPTAGDTPVQVADVQDWDLAGLKHAYQVMSLLPAGHASDNNFFQTLNRFKGGGGWHSGGGGDVVALGYQDGHLDREMPDDRTGFEKFTRKPKSPFTGKNIFSQVVSHEIGHAVDDKLGALGSDGYCMGDPRGGNWQVHADTMHFVNHIAGTFNTPLTQSGMVDDTLKMLLVQLAQGTVDLATFQSDMANTMNIFHAAIWGPLSQKNKTKMQNDPLVKFFAQDFEVPWRTASPKVHNARTYVVYHGGFASYDPAARARQVSNYQFRAPKEWFAEAYAAYFQVDDDGVNHGSLLKARDRTTYDYFNANVDQAL